MKHKVSWADICTFINKSLKERKDFQSLLKIIMNGKSRFLNSLNLQSSGIFNYGPSVHHLTFHLDSLCYELVKCFQHIPSQTLDLQLVLELQMTMAYDFYK